MESQDQRSSISQFLGEMRRRHVGRFALGYAAAAFILLQLAEIVFPAFGFGDSAVRILVVVISLAFPPALVLAWVYDITTEGIKRTAEGEDTSEAPSRLAVGALLVTTIVVTGAAGAYLASAGVFETEGPVGGGPAAVEPAVYDPDEPIRSLVVLPLRDDSREMDQEYLTLGMHEELIAQFSLLEDVRVVSRTTANQYGESSGMTVPEIARELGVDAVIQGSVNRGAETLRVTLTIIHGPSDETIVTLQRDSPIDADMLAFQTQLAHDVVHEIDSRHAEEVFTNVASADVAPEAQDAYFRAQAEYDRGTAEGMRRALDLFQEAVDADPTFARALTGLASSRFVLGLQDPDATPESLAQAHQEALAALAMDSSSSEAREVVSIIEMNLPEFGDGLVLAAPLEGSDQQVITAPGTFDPIEVDVDVFDSTWVTAFSRFGERIQDQIRERAARSGGSRADYGQARLLMGGGRYAEAMAVLEEVVAENPNHLPAWDLLAKSHIAFGRPSGATTVVTQWSQSGAVNAPEQARALDLQHLVEGEGERGYWIWKLDELDAIAAERPVPHMEYATAYAGSGDREEAFDHLMAALTNGERSVVTILSDPVWDEYRDDDGFRAVAEAARELRFDPRRAPRRPGGRSGAGR